MAQEEAWAQLWQMLRDLLPQMFFTMGGRLAPFYLLLTLLIVAAIYVVRKPGTSFREFVFPRRIYRWSVIGIDVWMYLLSFLLKMSRVFKISASSALVAFWLQSVVSPPAGDGSGAHPLLVAFVLLLAADFAIYWVHRFHHENRFFWPLHSLHHSVEEMSPFAAYREHPLFIIIAAFVTGIAVGVVQGGILMAFFGEVTFLQIAGLNALYIVADMAASNLRHSHIWLSFGRVVEHVLISPAQHQVHHSIDPRHHDKNYGEILAVWDWMFGTLYIPETHEDLKFGLADSTGRRLPQRHGTFSQALIVPLKDFVRGFLPNRGDRKDTPAE